MKILILILCCSACLATKQQTSESSKLNAIPSSQKAESYSPQPQQYVPVQLGPKTSSPPAATFVIGQPPQYANNPLFQQAVQQLITYYQNNPKARLELLQGSGAPAAQPGYQQYGQQQLPLNQQPLSGLHVVQPPHLSQPAHQFQAGPLQHYQGPAYYNQAPPQFSFGHAFVSHVPMPYPTQYPVQPGYPAQYQSQYQSQYPSQFGGPQYVQAQPQYVDAQVNYGNQQFDQQQLGHAFPAGPSQPVTQSIKVSAKGGNPNEQILQDKGFSGQAVSSTAHGNYYKNL